LSINTKYVTAHAQKEHPINSKYRPSIINQNNFVKASLKNIIITSYYNFVYCATVNAFF